MTSGILPGLLMIPIFPTLLAATAAISALLRFRITQAYT
jgi:hypothetical protein